MAHARDRGALPFLLSPPPLSGCKLTIRILALPQHRTQGSFWLAYRPIVRVELVTPSSFSSPTAYLPVLDPELGAPPEVVFGEEAPPAGAGEATVRVEERSGATGAEAQVGEPPRYEDAH